MSVAQARDFVPSPAPTIERSLGAPLVARRVRTQPRRLPHLKPKPPALGRSLHRPSPQNRDRPHRRLPGSEGGASPAGHPVRTARRRAGIHPRPRLAAHPDAASHPPGRDTRKPVLTVVGPADTRRRTSAAALHWSACSAIPSAPPWWRALVLRKTRVKPSRATGLPLITGNRDPPTLGLWDDHDLRSPSRHLLAQCRTRPRSTTRRGACAATLGCGGGHRRVGRSEATGLVAGPRWRAWSPTTPRTRTPPSRWRRCRRWRARCSPPLPTTGPTIRCAVAWPPSLAVCCR